MALDTRDRWVRGVGDRRRHRARHHRPRGNGDLYEADRSAQYDREVYELDDRHGTEELPPAEPFGSMSEAGRERYVQARREGLSFDDALALGRGHVMHGPVPPTLMPHDDNDGDADDR